MQSWLFSAVLSARFPTIFLRKDYFQATRMITNLETLTFTHFHPRYIYTVGPWFYIFHQSKCPKKKENTYKQLQIICFSNKWTKKKAFAKYTDLPYFLASQVWSYLNMILLKCLAPQYGQHSKKRNSVTLFQLTSKVLKPNSVRCNP